MKNLVLIAIIIVAVVLGVGVTIMLANDRDNSNNNQTPETTHEELVEEYKNTTNTASKIGDAEVLITGNNFAEEIENYEGIVMVDIFLPNCSYCQQMGPIVSEIAEEYPEYKIGKIDASRESVLATKFEVSSVPAFVFFKNGEEVDRIVGATKKETLVEKLKSIK